MIAAFSGRTHWAAPALSGRMAATLCAQSSRSPILGVIYWVGFIVISALVMLSLFIGAVTMSMTESMEQMKLEAKENQARKMAEKGKAKLEMQKQMQKQAEEKRVQKGLQRRLTVAVSREEERIQRKLKAVLLSAWDGVDLMNLLTLEEEEVKRKCSSIPPLNKCCYKYWRVSKFSKVLSMRPGLSILSQLSYAQLACS